MIDVEDFVIDSGVFERYHLKNTVFFKSASQSRIPSSCSPRLPPSSYLFMGW